MPYKIQHLGLGGVLDQAIAVVKDHVGLFARIVLLLLIPFNLLQGFLAYAATSQFNNIVTEEDLARAQAYQGEYAIAILVCTLLNFLLVIPVTNGAIIQAVARLYLGQPVTAMEAMGHGLRRFIPLVLTTMLMYVVIWFGFILLIIPGIYFAIWFGLSQEVVVIEGLNGSKALGRSRKLVHPYRGKFLALGIVLLIISWLLIFGVRLIPQPHTQVIASALVQAATTVLWTASLVVFYFSCRCGVENFDLHYLAEAIAAEPIGENENVAGGLAP